MVRVPEGVHEATPSLGRSLTWTLTGNLTYALCQWAIVAFLAKVSNPGIVGTFTLALSVCAPVFMLGNLHLRGAQATDARAEFEFSHYFGLRLVTSAAALLVVSVIALVITRDMSTLAVVVLMGITKVLEAQGDAAAGFLQRKERLDQIAVALMLRGLLSVVVFAIVFNVTKSLVIGVIGIAVTWAVVLLTYDLRRVMKQMSATDRFISGDFMRMGRLARSSLPLGVVAALLSLTSNIPRYVLVQYVGTSGLGIFASLAYPVLAANFIVNSLGQSFLVRLSKMYAEGNRSAYLDLLKKSVLFGLVLGAAGMTFAAVFGRHALTLLYRPEYAQHTPALIVLAGSTGILSIASFLGFGMTAARSFVEQLPISVVSVIACIVAAIVLVPHYGVTGAAYAMLVTALVQASSTVLMMRRVAEKWRA